MHDITHSQMKNSPYISQYAVGLEKATNRLSSEQRMSVPKYEMVTTMTVN